MGRQLMSPARNLAAKLMRLMLRHAPEERRDWMEAMLRELDFVEGEWAALFWAVGCTSAIFREWLREWGSWLWKQCANLFGIRSIQEENKMNSTGKKTIGVLSGMGIALALGVVAYLLRYVIADLLQTVGIAPSMWSHIFSVILPTELIVVAAAILLWRRKRAAVAVGLLVPAVLMGAHVVVFLVRQ
jgi:hypothetical protein